MSINARKTVTDAGYIAVGLGVMGFQQAQIRARAAQKHVSGAGDCLVGRARDARATLDTHTQTAKTQAEAQVRNTVARAGAVREGTVARAGAVREGVEKRVEPVVGQVQAQLGDLPERVVQAMEPVAARVREIAGNAA